MSKKTNKFEDALQILFEKFTEPHLLHSLEVPKPWGILQIAAEDGNLESIKIGEVPEGVVEKTHQHLTVIRRNLKKDKGKHISTLVSPYFAGDDAGGSILIPGGKFDGVEVESLCSFMGFDDPFQDEVACIVFMELFVDDEGAITGYYSNKAHHDQSDYDEQRCPERTLADAVNVTKTIRGSYDKST